MVSIQNGVAQSLLDFPHNVTQMGWNPIWNSFRAPVVTRDIFEIFMDLTIYIAIVMEEKYRENAGALI